MSFIEVVFWTIIVVVGLASAITLIVWIIDLIATKDFYDTIVFSVFAKKYKKYYKEQNDTVSIRCEALSGFAWSHYIQKKIKDFPTITFDQFKDFYYLSPESWYLKDCRVIKDRSDELSFTFTYKEWKKYQKFKKQVEEEKRQQQEQLANQKLEQEKVETTKKILESVQKDIDKIRAEAEKEFEEVKHTIGGVF